MQKSTYLYLTEYMGLMDMDGLQYDDCGQAEEDIRRLNGNGKNTKQKEQLNMCIYMYIYIFVYIYIYEKRITDFKIRINLKFLKENIEVNICDLVFLRWFFRYDY